jgi:hypothetical protein
MPDSPTTPKRVRNPSEAMSDKKGYGNCYVRINPPRPKPPKTINAGSRLNPLPR